MFVDTKLLHAGGNEARRAGEHAQDAADALSRGPLSSGMFGRFAAADAVHEAVTSAHAEHVINLRAHEETLSSVGAEAHRAAAGFTDMDGRNAAEIRAVRGGLA